MCIIYRLGNYTHKEDVKSRLVCDNAVVRDIISSFEEWECHPFNQEHQELRSLQSGLLASKELVQDFESAHCCGEQVVLNYFQQRLFSNEKSIYDRLPKNKCRTFANQQQADPNR